MSGVAVFHHCSASNVNQELLFINYVRYSVCPTVNFTCPLVNLLAMGRQAGVVHTYIHVRSLHPRHPICTCTCVHACTYMLYIATCVHWFGTCVRVCVCGHAGVVALLPG